MVELVDQVMAARENNEDTVTLEETIDRIVYGIYGLSEEEIEIIEHEIE